jgi:hypothetical protein
VISIASTPIRFRVWRCAARILASYAAVGRAFRLDDSGDEGRRRETMAALSDRRSPARRWRARTTPGAIDRRVMTLLVVGHDHDLRRTRAHVHLEAIAASIASPTS